MKQLLTILSVLILGYSLFAQTAVQPAGSGTSSDPYLVATLDNLYWITQNYRAWGVRTYYKQTADINAAADTSWDSGAGFSPIGNYNYGAFMGSYDGNGHTIDSLYINRNSTNYIGLFGYTSFAVVKNLGVVDANITGGNRVGGLIGQNGTSSSTVSNCYSTGSIIGGNYVGGLVGYNYYSSTVSNSYSTASISGSSDVGGLVGYNYYSSTISNSYTTGSINGGNYVGGLVGNNSLSTVSNSSSTVSVSGTGSDIGGLVGYNFGSTVSNSYSTGSDSGSNYLGGLVGYNDGSIINSCYSSGSVTADSNMGGLVGYNVNSAVDSSFWDMQTSGQSTSEGGTGKTTAEMKEQSTFTNAGWSDTTWYMNSGVNNGYPYLAWQNPGGAPLPVELIAFTANIFGDKVELKWNTTTEVNNYGFEVQRAEVNSRKSDGGSQSSIVNRQWTKVGFVGGSGNSNTPKEYSFTDDNPGISGTVEYRLKQIDNDGSIKYSNIVEVSFMKPVKFELYQNYPNPFNPTTTIQYSIPKAEHVTLKVYNELGQEAATLVNKDEQAGVYSAEFNGSNLSSGIYYYRINTGSFSEVKKLMLLK